MKKRVLVFCDFYLPSTGGGGGMWAVANIVERFADRYDFHIVTGNRNARGDSEPIAGVLEDEWAEVGPARVWYTAASSLNSLKIRRLFDDVAPDVVFLNSVFSNPVIRFLRSRRKGAAPNVPVIIAPCGELMPRALAIKWLKKRVFIAYAKKAKLYQGLIWRASFESERDAIKNIFGHNIEVLIAADLTPSEILPQFSPAAKPEKKRGHVKFIFLARIVEIKNLHFFLERLLDIYEGEIDFEIVGPIEDKHYWERCNSVIKKLPSNIRVTITGAVNREAALRHLIDSHYFVLPTLSENFGYVCIEALAAGCPLLISDRTDWGSIEQAGAGWILLLEKPEAWRKQIVACIDQDNEKYQTISFAARKMAVEWLSEPRHITATAELFEFAIAHAVTTS